MRAVQVLGPDARGQAVISVVRITDHFFFVVEWCDGDDRSENFFPVSAAGDRKIDNHRRRKEITFAGSLVRWFRRFAAEGDLAAFLLCKIDIELYFIDLRLVHDRALLRFLVQWVAYFQLHGFVDETIDEIFVSRSLHKNARTAQTNLALVREGTTHSGGDRGLKN